MSDTIRIVRGAAAGLVVAALVAVLVVLSIRWRDTGNRAADEGAVVGVARAEVVGLLTLDGARIKTEIADLRARTTGAFRTQFDGIADVFVSLVKGGRLSSTGVVRAAGLESLRGDEATVLVAADATVRNHGSAAPVQQHYRMRVSVHRVSGEWLVSGMEFVA